MDIYWERLVIQVLSVTILAAALLVFMRARFKRAILIVSVGLLAVAVALFVAGDQAVWSEKELTLSFVTGGLALVGLSGLFLGASWARSR